MIVHRITVSNVSSFPRFINYLYETLQEKHDLPRVSLLIKGIHDTVSFPKTERSYEIYYVESLKTLSKYHIFLLYFYPSNQSQNMATLRLHVEASTENIIFMQVDYSPRGNKLHASNIIAMIKELVKTYQTSPILTVEGYMDITTRFIRETNLSGFTWCELIHRYLHVSEDANKIPEVKQKRGVP